LLKLKLSGNLWHHRDFNRLWFSDTVSQFGNTFTGFALPVIAVLVFQATPLQMGILGAVGFASYPLLGLFVGVWADRYRRRRIMIACNLGRMLTLASIPLAYLSGIFSFIQIFLVATVNGVLSVFFDAAYQAYLPVLVDRQDLIEGNQKLQLSASSAQVSGPTLAGYVYGALGGALTIAFDAVGYLASALSLLSIKKSENKKERDLNGPAPNFVAEMKEGIHVVIDNPVLTRIAGCTATSNFGGNVFGAVFTIFALTYLHLSPFALGLVGSAGALGFVVGALATGKVTGRLGVGMTLAVSIAFGGISLAIPLAQLGYAVFVLGAIAFIGGLWVPAYNINQVSLRQAITPNRLQGRMNATMRTIVWGTIPIGSIVGGILGGAIGIVNTIYVGALISGLASLWILLGPVVKIRTQPEPVVS
jgi:MFS family permease